MQDSGKRSVVLVGLFSIIFSFISFKGIADPVLLGAAPDNNQEILLKALTEAQKSIIINVYELNSPPVVSSIIMQINNGKTVEILVEGQPVGGYSRASLQAQQVIVKAMQSKPGNSHFLIMSGKPRRFRFDHAKYTVIDERDTVIGSENYSPTGNPSPETMGNRGWEVLVRSPVLAQKLVQMFGSDSDPKNSDIVDATKNPSFNPQVFSESFGFSDLLIEMFPDTAFLGSVRSIGQHNAPILTVDAKLVDLFRSPDLSLAGLLKTIDRAATQSQGPRSLDVELMSFSHYWQGNVSPLFTALVDAAVNKGVSVRVLLNDESVFGKTNPDKGNLETVHALLTATRGHGLEARICKPRAMGITYIHNKGIIVNKAAVLLSSINWTENSVKNNRELALLIASPEVGKYYETLFNEDWNESQ